MSTSPLELVAMREPDELQRAMRIAAVRKLVAMNFTPRQAAELALGMTFAAPSPDATDT